MSPALEWLEDVDLQPNYGSHRASNDTAGLSLGILTLFPQISTPNASEGLLSDGIFFHGFALWTTQQYVVEARQGLEALAEGKY